MARKINSFFDCRLLVLFLIFILVASCGSKGDLAGSYRAEEKDVSGPVQTVLELKPNGEGAWKSGSEEIPFSWYVKGSELRINTKEGGVIVGDLEKDTIHLTLPAKKMTFRKIR
ncbi:MAG: hypothetical protein HY787_17150 [Deltaproteobacteria bacterium]|nr:hypothetical protein [Deltaproteobacteria bacterium]